MGVIPAEKAETEKDKNKGRNENGSILNPNSLLSPMQSEEDSGRRVRVEGTIWVVIFTMEQNVGEENSPIGKA